jgi:hypothetical protein
MAEIDQGNAKDTLLGVLTYIDSPFKLGVVVLLAMLSFSGYFIYANQTTFIDAYKKKSSLPSVEYSKADDVAQMLFKTTGADIVALLAVDTLTGKRTVMRIYTKDAGRYKDLDGMKIPLFTTSKQSNQETIRLFAGEVTEGPVHPPTSQLGYYYLSQGITYQAKTSIPPDPNLFVAMLTVSWKVKPANTNLNMLEVAAEMLTSQE